MVKILIGELLMENLFDAPEWRPSENYRNFDDSNLKKAKKSFSGFGISLFAFMIISYAAVFLIDLLFNLIFPLIFGEGAGEILKSPIYSMLVSTLPMYLVGFPILYILVRKMPSRKREKKKLPSLELFYTFLVAEAFMMVGSLLGESVSATISALLGIDVSNATADLIESAPIWLIFILVVIAAPIIEELIFRKLLIDKLSKFGDTVAIITSGVAFGLFHGNFYQFFYAAFLGILLAYLYSKSGKITYPIVFHMIINFIGSVLVIPLLKYQDILIEGTNPESGAEIKEFIVAAVMMGSYAIFQYAMVIAGVVIFFNALKYKRITYAKSAEISIPKGKSFSAVVMNVGAILFLAFSFVNFLLNILAGAI